jgi:tRNA (cmo5U34)-methyltransferase
MKVSNEITHGVSIDPTPEHQSEEYIRQRILTEREVSIKLTPHLDSVQASVAGLVSETETHAVIVEIGTGTGVTTEEVLKLKPGSNIITVDENTQRLDRAKYRLRNMSGQVTFVEEEALNYLQTLDEGIVDCVFTAFTLHNLLLEHRRQILIQVHRILKKGGLFVDADKHGAEDELKNDSLINSQISTIKENFEDPEYAQLWINHYLKDAKIDESRESYMRYLKRIGFNVERVLENGLEVITRAIKQ